VLDDLNCSAINRGGYSVDRFVSSKGLQEYIETEGKISGQIASRIVSIIEENAGVSLWRFISAVHRGLIPDSPVQSSRIFAFSSQLIREMKEQGGENATVQNREMLEKVIKNMLANSAAPNTLGEISPLIASQVVPPGLDAKQFRLELAVVQGSVPDPTDEWNKRLFVQSAQAFQSLGSHKEGIIQASEVAASLRRIWGAVDESLLQLLLDAMSISSRKVSYFRFHRMCAIGVISINNDDLNNPTVSFSRVFYLFYL
jgi:hypothetical protein